MNEVVAEQREAARLVVRTMERAAWRDEARRSRRGMGAPVRVSFLNAGGGRHPMASLMRVRERRTGGGRGGKTRLALLLSVLWVAGGGDHSTRRPASFWARLLGLRDPDDAGARAVRASWTELVHRGFATVQPGEYEGDVPTYTLRNEAGRQVPYTIPTGRDGDFYFRVPEKTWTLGLIGDPELTGPGLSMYLAALRTANLLRRDEHLAFPRAAFTRDVGLSDVTRKKGLTNLEELGILTSDYDSRDDLGEKGQRLRPRKIYTFASEWSPLNTPTPTNQGASGKKSSDQARLSTTASTPKQERNRSEHDPWSAPAGATSPGQDDPWSAEPGHR